MKGHGFNSWGRWPSPIRFGWSREDRLGVTLVKLTGALEKARAYALGSSGERLSEVP